MVASKKPAEPSLPSALAMLGRVATYEDLSGVPDHQVGEIVNGELVASPRPAFRHARVNSRLGAALDGLDRPSDADGHGPGGWIFLPEPELHFQQPLGLQVVVPDLAGWRRERMPEVPDVPFLELAPDWVAEVASPATARHDRLVKSAIYLDAGVCWMWLITPVTSTIEVLEANADKSRWTLVTSAVGSEPRCLPPFDALELDLERIWSMR